MKQITSLWILLTLSSCCWGAAVLAEDALTEGAPIVLFQGEQRLLHFEDLHKYSISGDAVHSLSPKNLPGKSVDALLLKAVKPGLADLWVWKTDGSSVHRPIQIEKWEDARKSPQLERALGLLQETEVLLTSHGAILHGTIQSASEASRIRSVVEAFPETVRNETECASSLLDEGTKKIQTWIRSDPSVGQLQVIRHDGSLRVVGSLSRPSDLKWTERHLRSLFPLVDLDIDSLPDSSPTVYFRVFLLELRKNRFGSLGITWPGSQSGAFHINTWGLQEALQIDLAIQAMEGDGSAKVLSNPELVVRAPGEAELFAGGELPIHTSTHYSSQLTWKPYGLTLRLKVTQVSGDKVRLDIFTEVSHLDFDLSNDSTPGIQSNRMKTQVDAQFGVPLLLSGLLQQGMRTQARGLPFLRRIPVLGALFGSEDYLNERSELVAILLPQARPPTAPMDKLTRFTPKGPIPLSRQSLSVARERQLRGSPRFPWNALE